MPTWNRAALLPRAIRSILAQTYKEWELIIIDDGSTDDTRSIVATFSDKNKNIKYFYQNHKGYAVAINFGCKIARGEFIAFQDDDDVSMPDRFKLQVGELLNDANVELVYGLTRWVDLKGKETGFFPSMLKKKDFRGTREQGFAANLWNGCKIPCTTVMMRKRHLPKDGRVFETQHLEKSQDWLHNLEVAFRYSIVGLSQVLVEVLRDPSCPSMMNGKEEILKNYRKVLMLAEEELGPHMKRLERWNHFRHAWGHQFFLEAKVIGGWRGGKLLMKSLIFEPLHKKRWVQMMVFGRNAWKRIIRLIGGKAQ